MSNTAELLATAWRKCPLDADGHGMYLPSMYVEMGYPEAFVTSCVSTQKSGTGKYQLYDENNNPVKEITGVYNLDILAKIAAMLNADTGRANQMSGRGFRASALVVAINNALCD